MHHRSTRRQAIKQLGGIAAALAVPAVARADFNPIGYRLLGQGWGGGNRKEIIGKSMSILAGRFLDTAVTLNGYAVDGNNYRLADDLWDITNLNAWFTGKGYRDILIEQLSVIRTLPFEKRPAVNIWGEYKPEVKAYGWANINKVKTKFSKTGSSVDGEFVLALNTFLVGGGGHLSDPVFWAGTIAHEMLHNLGHLHIVDRNDPQYDRCQLIAHERAVYYGGKYRRGMNRPAVLCGGRWTEPS